jgi:ribosomal protein S8E
MSQKGFVPRINGCGEHMAIAKMAINRAMTTGKTLWMMALDMKDANGSVSHKQLGKMRKIKIMQKIRKMMMDNYRERQ